MTIGERSGVRATATWLDADDCSVDDLRAIVEVTTDPRDYPYAADAVDNVLVYDCDRLRAEIGTPVGRRDVQHELVVAMADGPGLVVLAGAFPDASIVDRVTDAFLAMIADQHAAGQAAGDHFAKPGANDRVWNALEKLARREPDAFVDYYGNEIIELVSSAWLGPNYQITSQVNVVNPGGAAQDPHRDYHLGFQSDAIAQQFPAHAHRLSAVLTLQGAVAHNDMPVESGPTLYLPHSQKYELGYLAWRRPDFAEYFAEHHVQLPLAKGDAVFFDPALFHAAGHNRSADIKRMANLLQVSSAFGRAMESVDREAMSNALFPAFVNRARAGVPEAVLRNAIAASAEGYSFPTNLDRDQPIGGLAPETQAELVWRAVTEAWAPAQLRTELRAQADRRL
ncbi:MAG TPA: phytanoyl-CoA dioxygenase family protein [Ilumatobacteraceae bacterium]|nr:phytanoyl-CoA dioxygenase family protein [Ilumatobacteraceae bacterium]